MANIRQAFGNHAENSTVISNVIGDRIYYQKLPDSPRYPCSSYFIVTGNFHHNINFAYPRIQVDHWGKSPVIEVADAFKEEFQRFKGLLNDTVPVKQIELITENDPPYNSESNLYRITQDYRIIYKE